MTKLLVCIDGSSYADNICVNAAWAAKRMNAEINLLHVLRRHSDYKSPGEHTGSIGLGARSNLLEELTKVDEERGKLDQKKGKAILDHSAKVLKSSGINSINNIHRRGSLVETIKELEPSIDMIFIGKRGEHANTQSAFLGSNLEKVARAVHKPLFVVSSYMRPIKKFLIAYDGKENAKKAVEYAASQPLLKGLECHLLCIEQNKNTIDTKETEAKLGAAGYNVVVKVEQSSNPEEVISAYVKDNKIDLLATGAYSHSHMRSILLGSTTANLIKSCHIPLLLFR